MKAKIIQTIVIISFALILQGCATGYNRSLVMNKSSIGMDWETSPGKLEGGVSSTTGVITPTFEGGQTLPLMTNISSESNHISKFLYGRGHTVATGDAAYTMSYLYADCNRDVNDVENIPDVVLTEKPKEIPGPGEVKPAKFMSNTMMGVKMAWSRDSQLSPTSLNLGFKRKETVSTPISVSPDPNNPDQLIAGTPSFIATIDHSNDLNNNEANTNQYVQYFAIGESANQLALRSDTRNALLKRLTPNMRDSFCQDDFETKVRR